MTVIDVVWTAGHIGCQLSQEQCSSFMHFKYQEDWRGKECEATTSGMPMPHTEDEDNAKAKPKETPSS